MSVKNKRILVLGLGVSGVSTAKTLDSLGASVVISDSKDIDELQKYTELLKGLKIGFCLGNNNFLCGEFDLIVKSPGIPLDIPILETAKMNGIEIITDIELLYRLFPNKIVGITGTNGKTTTTCLTGHILEKCGVETHIMGNVGVGALWEATSRKDDDDVFVLEASSFQLESTLKFKPKISAILNLSPDHLAWHGGYEQYKLAKQKIMLNQDESDVSVLNFDDLEVRKLGVNVKSKVLYFSRLELLNDGVCLNGENIVYVENGNMKNIVSVNELKILGNHNIENAMAAIAIACALNLDIEQIKSALKEFNAVEHRLEYVDTINGVEYYNDSKGTNPDSSIKALEAIQKPIILIAGGYDKGSEFDEYIEAFDNKVKHLFIMGQTAELIVKTVQKYEFENYTVVSDLEEAMTKISNIVKSGDTVLLSPACASWGMYNNYEERGTHFKELVYKIKN